MRHRTLGLLVGTFALCPFSSGLAGIGYDAAVPGEGQEIGVEVWTDRGDEGVYSDGETVGVHFRTDCDAYVVVYQVNTDGTVDLLQPYGPEDFGRVRGGVAYRVDSPRLRARGADGVAYVQVLACREPLTPHLPGWMRPGYHHRGLPPMHWGWSEEHILRQYGIIVGDPFLGLAGLRAVILPSWRGPGSFGFATVTYCVNRHVYYPRYVCSDCHYGNWFDPYVDICVVFDIRVDPWWRDCYRPGPCHPRYVYWKRSSAPVRYRTLKPRWSTEDGRTNLVRHFGGRAGRERVQLRDRPSEPTREWSRDTGPERFRDRKTDASRPEHPDRITKPTDDRSDKPRERVKPREEKPEKPNEVQKPKKREKPRPQEPPKKQEEPKRRKQPKEQEKPKKPDKPDRPARRR